MDLTGIPFITNRVLTGTGSAEKFVETNAACQNLSFCKTGPNKTVDVLGSAELFKALRDSDQSKEFLLYPHGFNNQPWDDIFPNAKKMQAQLESAGLGHVTVVPIVWPCDNDYGIIKDYWDDQESAEFSGRFFARAIGKLMKWQTENDQLPCMKRIHIIAHSMGARVLLKAMNHFASLFGRGGVPYLFKNCFLMAADIPNECLGKGEEGEYICQASQRVICYYANDDMAMPASKISNVKNMVFSRRMGHTGPEDWSALPENKVFAVNCDSFNGKLDFKGHTYFMDNEEMRSPAFEHMTEMIKGKRFPPGQREIEL
jgi:esterase/lipase superfamily enzyme